ncbi:hypothetical protein Nepgr_014080 [Nepenthes gracilis]|uniref:Uncharacterized protein n=1 Tax=Nepenthes gracilis TaxID=150966 RepID=A0AAD3XPT3_NEPGR|nr:hypothetical protein Nepgr_014080 [Nepenthes gracilis]
MGIDADDVKILIYRSLHCLMKFCCQCAKDHPVAFGVVLLLTLLYIFLPLIFSILFYSSPFVLCAAIYLRGRVSSGHQNIENLKKDHKRSNRMSSHVLKDRSSMEDQKRKRKYGKYEKRVSELKAFEEEEVVSRETPKDDLIYESSMGERPMKTKKKHVNYASYHSENSSLDDLDAREIERTEASFPGISQINSPNPHLEHPRKFIGPITESDAESLEDDDESLDETNKAVQWTEDDQKNLMDLGSSEIERNRRLESLMAKRRARKQLSMQPRRKHNDLNRYDSQSQVSSIVVPRAAGDATGQPSSAPSVLLPARNPFDLPYDPSEEKPVLIGGSFEEEFFNNQQKARGPGILGDVNEDQIAKSLPGFLSKPRTLKGPGFSRCRRPSDMEENEEIFTGVPSEEAQLSKIQSDFCHDTNVLPPDEENQRKLDEQDVSHGAIPVVCVDDVAYNAAQLGHEEEKLAETNKKEYAETIGIMDEAGTKPVMVVEKYDEASSPSSSGVSEEVINSDKNEAFRNPVEKSLTCLIPKNKGLGNEKIGPLYDSSPTTVHPAKMEELSFYMDRPFPTPTYSIASDMHVEVSEAGSPSFNAEASSPTDRESVYDGDVDKDINSDDDDLWGASPHPVRSVEEFRSKFCVNETGEMGRSPLGLLPTHLSNDPFESSGQPTEAINQAISDSSFLSSPRSILPKDRGQKLVDSDHEISNQFQRAITDGQESRSSVSSSSEHLGDRVEVNPEMFLDNLVASPATDGGSSTTEEPSREESLKLTRQGATSLEALNLADENHRSVKNSIHESVVLVDDSRDQQDDTKDGDLEARQSSQNSVSADMQLESMVEQVPINLSSSPKSVLQQTVTTDGINSTSSEQNMHIDNRQSDGAVMKNKPLNDLRQENNCVLKVEKLSESPTGSTEAAEVASASLENAATEANNNLTELQVHKQVGTEDKSTEHVRNDSNSSSSQKITGNLQIAVEESDEDTESEAKVPSSIPMIEINDLYINEALTSVEKAVNEASGSAYNGHGLTVDERKREDTANFEERQDEPRLGMRLEVVMDHQVQKDELRPIEDPEHGP